MINLIKKVGSLTIDEWQTLKAELNFQEQYVEFGPELSAWAVHKNDGHIIYINSTICFEARKKALIHELMHLYNNDFEKGKPIFDKESNFKVLSKVISG